MVSNINITNLLKIIDKVNIIDIRKSLNYNNNHIPNAKNIDNDLLISNPNKYLDKNKTYYLYCQKGKKSYKTCYYLNTLGYKTINIIGGYESWILEK